MSPVVGDVLVMVEDLKAVRGHPLNLQGKAGFAISEDWSRIILTIEQQVIEGTIPNGCANTLYVWNFSR
jgi:hypothetical protein